MYVLSSGELFVCSLGCYFGVYFATREMDTKITLPRAHKQFATRVHTLLSGVPDLFDRNKILSGGDLFHYQVPHCIRVFFYFVWFVHHNFQFYFEIMYLL